MKLIIESRAEFLVTARSECCRDRTSIRATCYRSRTPDSRRQDLASKRGFHSKIGNQQNKIEAGRDGEALDVLAAHDRETAERSRRGIIWMALELGAKLKNRESIQRTSGQFIQPVENA
jgi:hypothetical protein